MSTQQTDALQCAADLEYSIARHGMQDAFTLNAYRAMKMVRTQQASITALESQLAQRFDAADVATAPAARPAQEAEPLLDYAMQIAHERELRVTGFPHDEDGAKRVFEAAVMRHTATGAAQTDSVQEDAACWHWLAEYLVGTRTDLDDEIVASETVNDLRKLVEAALAAQGGKDA